MKRLVEQMKAAVYLNIKKKFFLVDSFEVICLH